MKILALDISTKTGWSVFENEIPLAWGTLFPDKTVKDFGDYPANYVSLSKYLINNIYNKIILKYLPDKIIVEETNKSKAVYSQKILEFLHYSLINRLLIESKNKFEVYYVKTGDWRKTVNARLNNQEKKINIQIAKIKKQTGKKLAKINGKVVGKKGRKHVSIRVVKELFGIDMKRSEEDAADSLLLGLAYLRGCLVCNGFLKNK